MGVPRWGGIYTRWDIHTVSYTHGGTYTLERRVIWGWNYWGAMKGSQKECKKNQQQVLERSWRFEGKRPRN